ncbi:exodeoxyribonuclease V beta subunit [Raineyella antarctica]|uniref:RecBCD enzyme subunit RecB n=1 Tax=Raineyella antarctica TaxID=1577474 RepID=A0A1G6GVP2_9ACTN|nr:UvrD-helicase domain-containing protein [Raineyella antarctica]SDB85933.1 exodeoxyribonuclease V beta subunit [Raineyella antarctica]
MTVHAGPHPSALDLTADLPSGTTLLEASAGTGKTHTIASLVVLTVARGTPLRSVLLITFTRKAARELRDRVRQRMGDALATLAGRRPEGADPLWEALLAGDRELSAARLRAGLADFDGATISTIHEFAGSMLGRLGLLAHRRPDSELLADESALVAAVTDDLYLARYGASAKPSFSRQEAGEIVARAVANPFAAIVPDPAQHPVAAERVDFAARARQEFGRRLEAAGRYTYDDLIGGLAAALRHPSTGEATAARLRAAYRVVMVDEFQDTDPRQWEVLRSAFHGHSDLYLIGDPKQAIYGFRGGDVQTYLAAAREADQRHTLDTNWRSDESVVRGITSLLAGTALGDPDITVVPVTARHRGTRLHDPVGTPAPGVSLRVVTKPYRYITAQRERIRHDVVAVAARLLTDGTAIDTADGPRPVHPGDIAVLVRYNTAAEQVAERLVRHGIPAVVNGADSVLRSPAAGHWRDLLATLVDPQPAAVHRLALGPFVGWPLEDLVRADEDAVAGLFIRARSWGQLWETHGVAAVLEAALSEGDLAASSIGRTGSEREITDLRHVGQLLHQAETGSHLAPRGLLAWLERQICARRSAGDDEQTLRLETEAEAVQVITVHSAKGLEFPIVLLPDMADKSDRHGTDVPEAFTVHDPAGDRLVDVGGRRETSSRARHQRAREEEAGEELRLLYVAMTRASSQVVLWWAPHETHAAASPLHRVLFGERDADGMVPLLVPVAADQRPPEFAGVVTSYVDADPTPIASAARPLPDVPVVLRRFGRPVDTAWRRTSYSGLTAAQHAEPHEVPGAGDEPGVEDIGALADTTVPGTSPWTDLPSGARFGTLVHEVLEAWDPAAADLGGIVPSLAARAPVEGLDPGLLVTALDRATRTPLGGDLSGLSLADVPLRDRLSELDFELPLTGGDRPGPATVVADIADCLDRHLAPDDPLATYADRLREPGLGDQVLRGFLTGSIDAVLRVPGTDPRFVVVDYKTNRLGPPAGEAPLPLAAYTPDRLAEAMMAAHYPLQALLYCVALHRYLGWRLPGYRPELHLGGIRYLFVRGMAGPDTPMVAGVPCGVFAWRPTPALVTELSDLVTEGGPAR